MVSKVQVAFVRVPEKPQRKLLMSKSQGKHVQRVLLSPLSIVSVAVALKLGVDAGLIDSTAAFLDFSECPTPIIMALIVATNPVSERPSIYFEREIESVFET